MSLLGEPECRCWLSPSEAAAHRKQSIAPMGRGRSRVTKVVRGGRDARTAGAPYYVGDFWIERLKEGERDTHSIAGLSDWAVLTPFGTINPHAFHARRMIRENREEMRRIKREAEVAETTDSPPEE